jgi:hypothetical protein
MIGGLLAAAALTVTAPDVMDGPALRHAMESARRTPAADLVGRRFQISIPFVDERKRTMQVLQSPARWRYDFARNELTLMIGLGQISAQNYNHFDDQGLKALPTLQTAFFDGSELRSQTTVETLDHDTKTQEVGVRSIVTNYGLAIPYADGVSALPPHFEPFMVQKLKMDQQTYHRLIRGMTLVLEGSVTDLGQKPAVFCGSYDGRLAAPDPRIDDTVRMLVTARQCFATAKIDHASVLGTNGVVVATWPKP